MNDPLWMTVLGWIGWGVLISVVLSTVFALTILCRTYLIQSKPRVDTEDQHSDDRIDCGKR